MKIAIVGSRTFNNYEFMKEKMDELVTFGDSIISGGAVGADMLAQDYARYRGMSITIYYPNWDVEGRGAGFKRNAQIATNCDMLVAFWVNESKGTKHTIDTARRYGKKVIIFNCPLNP